MITLLGQEEESFPRVESCKEANLAAACGLGWTHRACYCVGPMLTCSRHSCGKDEPWVQQGGLGELSRVPWDLRVEGPMAWA